MGKIKKGEFIELEYTGRTKKDNNLFDTTYEKIAKSEKSYNPKVEYGPIIACIGEKHVINGLDSKLEGKEIGKEYSINISVDEGFGKKDSKLIRIVSRSLFKKQNLNPAPGLQINAEGMIGIIRSVTGGRVLVDFNHPLAGKELVYDLKVIKKIEDTGDKLVALLKYGMAINKKMYEYKLNKEVLKLKLKLKLPDPFKSKISEKIKGTIPEITKIEFSEETTNKGKK